jgi:hypothetical protein
MATPRNPTTRIADTCRRLAEDVDCWVASASAHGDPYLVPLSFLWDGEALLVATPAGSRTSRNLSASGTVRVGLGPTRDVVLVDGVVESFAAAEIVPDVADAFAAKAGFDPRVETPPYRYFRITPVKIQAWREANELAGREVMRAGVWVAED